MKIESLLRRPGGTKVTLESVEYHFKPGPDGREFADVTNVEHIGIFASIREGYRVAGLGTVASAPVEKPVEEAVQEPPKPIQSRPYVDSAASPTKDELYEGMTRPELAAEYYSIYRKHPPPRLSAEKLIEALREG